MIGSVLPNGLVLNKSSVGASVARAKAAKASMIKLTQSIWTALNGESSTVNAPIILTAKATMFTVN